MKKRPTRTSSYFERASSVGAWFGGPSAENGDILASTIERILADHQHWRRNYFPEDGFVLDSHTRRLYEVFNDEFEDRLMELLAALKADFPFHSPRYAAHMVSEQTLPSIAGYFAGMLYNPNNVTSEVAPVTVRLELEAARMIAGMLGYGEDAWGHLTSGGTVANLEALWIARSVKYLPLIVTDIANILDLDITCTNESPLKLISMPPMQALNLLRECFVAAESKYGPGQDTIRHTIDAYRESQHNVATHGIASVLKRLSSEPVLVVPETCHYSLQKVLDILGIGNNALIRVGVDPDFRMDVADLESKIASVEKRGNHVLAVMPVVGTTEEGAVDPIDKIAALRRCREQSGQSSFWLHADAAYGGYLRTITIPNRLGLGEPTTLVKIDNEVHEIALPMPISDVCKSLEALNECDSVTVDPHKLGYIPYPAGAVCFRSNLVKPVARQDAPYLEEAPGSPQQESATESIGVYIIEGSKPGAAAAAVWLSHTIIPLDNTGHGLLIQESVRNACELFTLLERWREFKNDYSVQAVCLCPPGSNIVCYAFVPTCGRWALSGINALNRAVFERFTVYTGKKTHIYDQKFFVSRTTLSPQNYSVRTVSTFLQKLRVTEAEYLKHGVFLLRSVVMNPWYGIAKAKGRYFISELVEELYTVASEAAEQLKLQNA